MIIYIGADHRGYELKEYLKKLLRGMGYEVSDVGDVKYDENDDYPDFAVKVAEKVSREYEQSRGILLCGSGVGVDIVANKFPKIRSALVFNPDQAFDVRNDDDTNVLALPADHLKPEDVKNIVVTWLSTPFSGEEKYIRRLRKISEIEVKNLHPASSEEE